MERDHFGARTSCPQMWTSWSADILSANAKKGKCGQDVRAPGLRFMFDKFLGVR